MNSIQAILDFWFEGVDDTTPIETKKNPFKKWFLTDPAFDQEIRKRFQGDLINAAAGQYQDWEATPQGILALILLFDQFSRNMYRNTPKMHAFDPLACRLCLSLLKCHQDQDLPLIYRLFAYMTLMHAEDAEKQQLSVQQFKQLVEESKIKNPSNTHYYFYSLDCAKRHCATIERFSRFPHRNRILGRTSTPQELEFLRSVH